ncbi:GatB/YqeY domain-containing protein [Earliella scabrosa]|nr:GatB/YqeY domain-containing protein [Earliella scabrosa]
MYRITNLSRRSLLVRPPTSSPIPYALRVRQLATSQDDLRARLMTELKEAMKSVLSEVYAADKAASGTAPPSAVAGILRKAATRRTDAAAEFTKASRPDLAEKEQQEAAILHAFLPPLLPASDIDRVLTDVLASPEVADAVTKGPPQKALGQVFKAFYTQVDKSTVDPDLVRQRAQALLSETSSR